MGACNLYSVVVNYNTTDRRTGEVIAMRSSDRIWATGLAIIVWLVAGYAVASRATAPSGARAAAFEATAAVGTAAVGLAIGRP